MFIKASTFRFTKVRRFSHLFFRGNGSKWSQVGSENVSGTVGDEGNTQTGLKKCLSNVVVEVNSAFTEITGVGIVEVVGRVSQQKLSR